MLRLIAPPITKAEAIRTKEVQEARKAAKLTQVQLAERVGKDQTFISIIERGQRRVDVLEFVALARAMKADPAKLFAEVLKRLPDSVSI